MQLPRIRITFSGVFVVFSSQKNPEWIDLLSLQGIPHVLRGWRNYFSRPDHHSSKVKSPIRRPAPCPLKEGFQRYVPFLLLEIRDLLPVAKMDTNGVLAEELSKKQIPQQVSPLSLRPPSNLRCLSTKSGRSRVGLLSDYCRRLCFGTAPHALHYYKARADGRRGRKKIQSHKGGDVCKSLSSFLIQS